MHIRNNLLRAPHSPDLFQPDLIDDCDAVIGKVGYSTLAEVYHTGAPFGYISLPSFVESEVLKEYQLFRSQRLGQISRRKG